MDYESKELTVKIGDLVRCQKWTLFPDQIGAVVDTYKPASAYDPPNDLDVTVLIHGQERLFMSADVEIIS